MSEQTADNETIYDIAGVGNAIVDILCYMDETFLEQHNLPKGSMTLVDNTRSKSLRDNIGTATECSGGSVANTLAGVAMLGGKTTFIGKVANDHLGDVFKTSLTDIGVTYNTPQLTTGEATGNCLVFVTQELSSLGHSHHVERTMATYLGASSTITEKDIDFELIKQAKVTYIEGYLWDKENEKSAVNRAIAIAKKHNRKVAFSLSDVFCVERHRDEFLELVNKKVDILFANIHEIEALFQETDIHKILYHLSNKCEVAIVTRGEKGSYILTDGAIYTIDAEKVDEVYDVTGAGDLYASGFLYGYVNDFDMETCGKLGSLCAAEVIKYLGARPATKLKNIVNKL